MLCEEGWPTDIDMYGDLFNPGEWVILNQESSGMITSYTHDSPHSHFMPNTTLNYRLRARNLVGWGVWSDIS